MQSNGVDLRAGQDSMIASPLVKADKGMQQFSAIMSLLGRLQTSEKPGWRNISPWCIPAYPGRRRSW